MTKKQIRFVQWHLNSQDLDSGPEDGILGSQTLGVLSQVEGIPANWSKRRKVTGYIQKVAIENEIETGDIDGYWGPQTEFAFDVLYELLVEQKQPLLWRPEDLTNLNPNDWPAQSSNRELEKIYGKVGNNQTRIQLPYPHRLAWDQGKTLNSFLCHEKVHDSLHRVLTRVLDQHGEERLRELRLDLWGGCLNVRKMRGGSRYSLHSWGIALDYDPQRNRLKWGRDRAAFARPEYDEWWKIWQQEGWVSLGRSRNFDWMHVQAATL